MRRKYKTKKIRPKTKTVSGEGLNSSYVLKKTDLQSFLSSLLRDFNIIGPKSFVSSDYLLSYINSPEELVLDYPVTTNTVKEFLFPRQEELFSFKQTKTLQEIEDIKPCTEKPVVFFGVRSCDVRAVSFHDYFFSQEPRDSYYWQRRNNSVIISIACNKPPKQGCFCNITSSGSFLEDKEPFDVQLIDIGLVYLVECNSQKGQILIKRHKEFLHKAVEVNIQERLKLKEKSLKEFPESFNLLKIHKRLLKEDFSNLWQELGFRCQNCAGCEFICPTCFCFYTQDINRDSEGGVRMRAWDSCTFCSFSRMAGDNNPYPTRSERISRRFFCKLFNTFKWSGMFGCVGCGRCSFVCPVNLDMESFITSLSKATKEYKPLLKEP